MICRLYLHGPGGSGKTFMLNHVIIPVYEEFLPGTTRGLAAQNSAARLIGGATFHSMAGLSRGDPLRLEKPDKKKLAKMQHKWRRVALLFIDEISLTPPNLLAALHASACWGRLTNITVGEFLENVFGNILCQVVAGDHLQLNPVLEQSLIGAFGISVPGVPTYERMEADKRQQRINVDQHGYAVLRSFLDAAVLFRGSHRFKQGDPLAELLETMRCPGGRPLSDKLKAAMRKQIYDDVGTLDQRLSGSYKMIDAAGQQVGPSGFFANGVFSAVNWDQVARLQQLCAFESARSSFGIEAAANTSSGGRPQVIQRCFPVYLGKSFNRANADFLSMCKESNNGALLKSLQHAQGRLLYYVQAVDLVHQAEFHGDRSILKDILRISNMASKTGNLMSFLPLHEGLRVKVTKKLLPPEIVQECPAEIVSFQFHPNERFGIPGGPAGGTAPSPEHRCWQRGYVRLDYLPTSVTLRIQDDGWRLK